MAVQVTNQTDQSTLIQSDQSYVRVFLITWLEGILIGFHHLSSAFLGHVPEHTCAYDHVSLPRHWTESQRKNFSIPLDNDEYSKCEMFDIEDMIINQNENYFTALNMRPSTRSPCSSWQYSTDHGHTIVSEWNLVCDRTALLSTVQVSC